MDLTTAAAALNALGSPVRLEVYRTLVRAGHTGLSIAELQHRLGGIPRSTLAHHLHKLVLVGLVEQEKDGTNIFSRANYTIMSGLLDYLADECCADDPTAIRPIQIAR